PVAQRRHESLEHGARRRSTRGGVDGEWGGDGSVGDARARRRAGRVRLTAVTRFRRGVLVMTMREMALAVAAAAMIGGDGPRPMQSDAPRADELRQQIERRFEVLPLRSGLALRPKSPISGARGVRSIELTDGTIAIDGVPATGAELRNKLGRDADMVIRLSYLELDARQNLFSLV